MFDEQQTKVIEHPVRANTATIVKAAAGSGKTTTVVGKISAMVKSGVSPTSIVATAFNNKAAKELYFRFRSEGINHINVGTLHSLGKRLLEDFTGEKYSVMTEWNSTVMVRDLIEKELPGYAKKDLTAIAKEILEANDLLKSLDIFNIESIKKGTFQIYKYTDTTLELTDQFICSIMSGYYRLKKAMNLMDYSDMLYYLVERVRQDYNLLSQIRGTLKYFFIDEAQDLDQLQYSMVLLLSKGSYACFVGDTCQSIYGWRNAKPNNFSKEYLSKYFGNIEEFWIYNNYRSPANIVSIANHIRNIANDDIQSKAFKPRVNGAFKITQVRSNIQEGAALVKYIKECTKDGYSYRDIVVLTRSNYYAKHTLEPALVRANIPYLMVSRNSGKRLTEKDINIVYFSALSLVNNPGDIYSLCTMAEKLNGIGAAFTTKLAKDYISNSYKMPNYLGRDATKVEQIVNLKNSILELTDITLGTDPRLFITSLTDILTHYYINTSLMSYDKDRVVIERSLLHWFNFHLEAGVSNIREVLNKVLHELDNFDEDEDFDAIKVGTVHSYKGLQSPIVFAMGFNSVKEMQDEFKEEANILYVQMTRATERQYVIDSLQYVTQDNRIIYPKKNPSFAKLLKLIRGE